MTKEELVTEVLEEATKDMSLPDDLEMTQIKSSLTGKSYKARRVDKKHGGYYEITHDILEKAFLDTQGIECSYKPIKADKEHAVVECTLKYGDKKITKVGEATPKNCKGPIQWNIPVSTAYMRAFDRAMVRLLDFDADRKVYSSMELGMCSYFEGQISRLEYQLKMVDEEVLTIAKNVAEALKKRLTEGTGKSSDEQELAPDKKESEEETVPQAAYCPSKNTILRLGVCKGMTVGEAFADKAKWNAFMRWIADIDYKTSDEETAKQARYFKEYALKTRKEN